MADREPRGPGFCEGPGADKTASWRFGPHACRHGLRWSTGPMTEAIFFDASAKAVR